MKYIILSVKPAEKVLISYLSRNYNCLVKRLKTVVKVYIPEESLTMELKSFVSFCKSIVANKDLLRIKRANAPIIDKLSLVEYTELLFDSKAEEL